MIVAEVVGNVWASRKHPHLNGKLLLVRPIDPLTGRPLGDAQMAVDGGVDAGPGSVVLVVDEGGSARAIIGDPKAPVRTVVCAIVDQINAGGKVKKYA
ncbi:MAG: EutN/CcmL family microcompartment protein [Elusimicrobia bacterium]|nr:EutN/CcmL family microcompartment protein [Elusimicrobiota bacterium]